MSKVTELRASLSKLFNAAYNPAEAVAVLASFTERWLLPEMRLCLSSGGMVHASAPAPQESREEQLHRVLSELREEGISDAFGDPVPSPLPSTVSAPLPQTDADVESLANDEILPDDAPETLVMTGACQTTASDPWSDPKWDETIPYSVADLDPDFPIDQPIPFTPAPETPLERAVRLVQGGMAVRTASRKAGAAESSVRNRLKRLKNS